MKSILKSLMTVLSLLLVVVGCACGAYFIDIWADKPFYIVLLSVLGTVTLCTACAFWLSEQ